MPAADNEACRLVSNSARPALSPVLRYGAVTVWWTNSDGTRGSYSFLAPNTEIEEALDAQSVTLIINGWEMVCHVMYDACGLRLEAFERERL